MMSFLLESDYFNQIEFFGKSNLIIYFQNLNQNFSQKLQNLNFFILNLFKIVDFKLTLELNFPFLPQTSTLDLYMR